MNAGVDSVADRRFAAVEAEDVPAVGDLDPGGADVVDGRMTRIDEYLDSAHVAALLERPSR